MNEMWLHDERMAELEHVLEEEAEAELRAAIAETKRREETEAEAALVYECELQAEQERILQYELWEIEAREAQRAEIEASRRDELWEAVNDTGGPL